ncbi:HTH-type transcriptional regulator DmlR [Vibrio aerogenes CECT 7868]|uniref:HTH-type transcriptional regulator DmlR n=1 Tax=Vibrio aerogenes CECT 7868 TaxID=1216006 RepID=A0A1M5Z6U9_9VIBR|nr:LysR family transcriptional regulator [Vibrio aerogenes]SHI19921.1 HTH-type transcriptional regulator DmlR [Vibrio aerogenes CECT 7868]
MDKLETMKAFLAVVQEGSFSKASEKLNLSPQLVSKYVSWLEEKLKTRLLNRTTRKVSVTEAGRAYFERCQQILIDLEETENSLSNLEQHVSGTLTVSAPMSFGTRHLARLLVDFQRTYPEVEIDLQLTDAKVDIVDQGIDVAIRIGHLKDSSLIAKKITPIRLSICASPDYLTQYGEPASPDELVEHSYLKYAYTEENFVFSQFDQHAAKLRLRHTITANNGDLLMNAAVHGGGIIIQPTFITGEAIAQGQLKRILTGYEPSPLNMYAVYAHRKFLASKVRSFVDFVVQYYGDIPYWDQY